MKKKLPHLFFAFLTGVIFLLVYFLILSGDYGTVFIKKEILLYTLYVLSFLIGVFSYYYYQKNSVTKRFIRIFPICMLVFSLVKHSSVVYSYYKYLISYIEMPKELRGYDLLDDKEVRQEGKIIMPIPQNDIYAYTDLFFDLNDNLLVYYKYDAEEVNVPMDCILKYDKEGNLSDTLYLENNQKEKRNIALKEGYLIDFIEKSYSSFMIDGKKDFLPMKELKGEGKLSEKDIEAYLFDDPTDLITIIHIYGEENQIVIIKKENELYYSKTKVFFSSKDIDFSFPAHFYLFATFKNPTPEIGEAPKERHIEPMYYLKKQTYNSGLQLLGERKSFEEEKYRGDVYFKLLLNEQQLHLKTFYCQNLFPFGHTDDIRYYQNQNETLEIYNDIRLYTNRHLSYALLGTGYKYYLIKNKS